MTFREDGYRAVDWAADYLERIGELPVLAQVEPGEIRARLPQSPPEQPEPFSAVLRDLDEILLPGITHWQHPRFFAYFAVSSAEPGILAELLAATLNSVAILWRTAPASTELEVTRARLGRPADRHPSWVARPHRGHGVHFDARGADRGAPRDRAQRRRVLRARAFIGREGRAHARDGSSESARRRSLSHAARRARARRCCGRRRHRRDDVVDLRRSGGGDRGSLRRGGYMAARGRRLRRLRDGLPRAPLGVRGRRPRGLPRRQCAQVDVHADGLLADLDEPAGRVPRRLLARSGVPADDGRGRVQHQRVRAGPRPPLP